MTVHNEERAISSFYESQIPLKAAEAKYKKLLQPFERAGKFNWPFEQSTATWEKSWSAILGSLQNGVANHLDRQVLLACHLFMISIDDTLSTPTRTQIIERELRFVPKEDRTAFYQLLPALPPVMAASCLLYFTSTRWNEAMQELQKEPRLAMALARVILEVGSLHVEIDQKRGMICEMFRTLPTDLSDNVLTSFYQLSKKLDKEGVLKFQDVTAQFEAIVSSEIVNRYKTLNT